MVFRRHAFRDRSRPELGDLVGVVDRGRVIYCPLCDLWQNERLVFLVIAGSSQLRV